MLEIPIRTVKMDATALLQTAREGGYVYPGELHRQAPQTGRRLHVAFVPFGHALPPNTRYAGPNEAVQIAAHLQHGGIGVPQREIIFRDVSLKSSPQEFDAKLAIGRTVGGWWVGREYASSIHPRSLFRHQFGHAVEPIIVERPSMISTGTRSLGSMFRNFFRR